MLCLDQSLNTGSLVLCASMLHCCIPCSVRKHATMLHPLFCLYPHCQHVACANKLAEYFK